MISVKSINNTERFVHNVMKMRNEKLPDIAASRYPLYCSYLSIFE